jgi:hypothetical protein
VLANVVRVVTWICFVEWQAPRDCTDLFMHRVERNEEGSSESHTENLWAGARRADLVPHVTGRGMT